MVKATKTRHEIMKFEFKGLDIPDFGDSLRFCRSDGSYKLNCGWNRERRWFRILERLRSDLARFLWFGAADLVNTRLDRVPSVLGLAWKARARQWAEQLAAGGEEEIWMMRDADCSGDEGTGWWWWWRMKEWREEMEAAGRKVERKEGQEAGFWNLAARIFFLG